MTIKTSDLPEVDINRINSIRSRLDLDTYIVDSDHIATKFIDLELALCEKTA